MTHSPALTLKPCPFCGQIPSLYPDGDIEGHEVLCETKDCTLVAVLQYSTEGEAVVAWNRRAELAASADAGRRMYTIDRHIALREAHCISIGDEFWAARPGTNDAPRSLAFDAGFVRGFDIATKLADERAALARPTADAGKLAEEAKRQLRGLAIGDGSITAIIDQLAALSRPAPATMANGLTEAETSATASVAGLSVSAQGDERAAFEAWLGREAFTERCDSGKYANAHIDAMWSAWQARAQVAQGDERAAAGPWKCGNEFLPYHPSASHVEPSYRDGWNACYKAGLAARAQVAQGDEVDAWLATAIERQEAIVQQANALRDFMRAFAARAQQGGQA